MDVSHRLWSRTLAIQSLAFHISIFILEKHHAVVFWQLTQQAQDGRGLALSSNNQQRTRIQIDRRCSQLPENDTAFIAQREQLKDVSFGCNAVEPHPDEQGSR